MDLQLPEKYINTKSIYRTLGQNGDDSIIGAGFLHFGNNREHIERISPTKYGGRLLLSGTGKYTDSSNNEYELNPGAFIQCFPYKKHCIEITSDSKWLECYIVFGTPLFKSLLAMNILSLEKTIIYTNLNLNVIEGFDNIITELSHAKDSELTTFVPKIINLLILINKHEIQNNTTSSYTEIINEITEKLSNNLEKKIELKDLLKNHPISYDRFRFIFKQKIGVSPGVYRINKKLEKARELLTSKKYKVYQVAEMLGYPDAYSFSKQFSRFVGTSPKDYIHSV